ncbi:hypothetical protein F5Y04DRAFT_265644 [Hypomontagnella monticulosa]|nr:hypothetical protein F5Y04DRAFT_265644 [Hypomontagnella monticulosa]
MIESFRCLFLAIPVVRYTSGVDKKPKPNVGKSEVRTMCGVTAEPQSGQQSNVNPDFPAKLRYKTIAYGRMHPSSLANDCLNSDDQRARLGN